jgi:hypothetical protein
VPVEESIQVICQSPEKLAEGLHDYGLLTSTFYRPLGHQVGGSLIRYTDLARDDMSALHSIFYCDMSQTTTIHLNLQHIPSFHYIYFKTSMDGFVQNLPYRVFHPLPFILALWIRRSSSAALYCYQLEYCHNILNPILPQHPHVCLIEARTSSSSMSGHSRSLRCDEFLLRKQRAAKTQEEEHPFIKY